MALLENLLGNRKSKKTGPLGMPLGPVREALARYEPRLDRPKVFSERPTTKGMAGDKIWMLSPSEMVNEVSKKVGRRGFILREYQIVGVWIIRDRNRDRPGTGGVVMHPWTTTNYYGTNKWAVYPENRPSNPQFFNPNEQNKAVEAAIRIARKRETRL